MSDPQLDTWLGALEARHLADLTTSEVTRALRALSSCYVERRGQLRSGAALEGAGKRAAFALYYAPLHLLTVRAIVAALGLSLPRGATLVDLGCGTGAAGAGWAVADPATPRLLGIDRHPWAAREAAWSWRVLGLQGRAVQGDVARVRWPREPFGVVAAWAINELDEPVRNALRDRLLGLAAARRPLLIIEPLAGRAVPWWRGWQADFEAHGARADEWRFPVSLPEIVVRFDRAAGLDHSVLTARSLALTP